MQFELSSTRKQIFQLLKLELLKNSFQAEDFQKTSLFVCIQETGGFGLSLLFEVCFCVRAVCFYNLIS